MGTVRLTNVVSMLLRHNRHTLVTGQTGTGKSAILKDKLANHLSPSHFSKSMLLNFSARTGSNQTQTIIEGKLIKRRKGVLGAPLNHKCVVFIDDLNMPAKEKYGAQPPIELLRQWMDHKGWYDLKTNTFTQILDVIFLAAMGPPGGGRTQITQRYVRHFNLINIVPFGAKVSARVFSSFIPPFSLSLVLSFISFFPFFPSFILFFPSFSLPPLLISHSSLSFSHSSLSFSLS